MGAETDVKKFNLFAYERTRKRIDYSSIKKISILKLLQCSANCRRCGTLTPPPNGDRGVTSVHTSIYQPISKVWYIMTHHLKYLNLKTVQNILDSCLPINIHVNQLLKCCVQTCCYRMSILCNSLPFNIYA